jgi:hypothetical protein
MLAVPPIIVTFSPGGWSSWLSASVRLTAMYAFTLIFMDIMIGALLPYFYVLFKARGEYLIHVGVGSLGFLLALTHGLIVLTQRYYRGFGAAWVIGPAMLILLVFTVWVAFDRVRLKSFWRYIHQINYLIFAAAFVKAVLIGTDLKGSGAADQAVMVLFSVYVGLATLALVARVRRFQVQASKRKQAAAKAAAEAGPGESEQA